MLNYSTLFEFYKNNDRVIYLSLRTLKATKGKKVLPYAAEILDYLNHRQFDNPLGLYSDRSNQLIQQQQEFETKKAYRAASYADVEPIDREVYNLSLLLSFIITHHRFEILEQLVNFIKLTITAPKTLLSVGVGTGYEIKLVYDYLKAWDVAAFDISEESINYASDLLTYFNYPTSSLRSESFPLETDEHLDHYRHKFGKIIICELLEHLENPGHALSNLREVLHPEGKMFLTMAINIAQEDHVYLYSSIEQARQQVLQHKFRIVHESVAPVVMVPFQVKNSESDFTKGNYICVVEKIS